MKSEFPIKDLRDRLAAQQDLERTIVSLSHSHESEKQKLKSIEKSIKLLDEVPCGDSYPTCKFIKDSHKNKKSLPDQIRHVDETLDKLKAAKKSLTVLQSEDLASRLEKYDEILKKETDMHIKLGRLNLDLQTFTQQISSMNHVLEESRRKLTTMRLNVATEETAEKISNVRREIKRLTDEMNSYDAQRLKISEQIGQNESDILRYEAERIRYSDLIVQWRAYELFIEAVSHRGIPLKIMSTQLPVINTEISKILQGVVGFTVELESMPGTNDMEIYINYGDSRRVIECGSGMEKMMASLAIRVALISISSLPRADLLIIDEGFGALDETNVEACNRLLSSFKKWFRNILVISHVDAVKDAVDNVLDITHHNMDSKIVYEKNA
jgi:exonuclease SbcC